MTGFSSWAGAGAIVVALAACGHEQPFQNRNAALDSTFGGGPDRQLTFNPAADVRPAWLSDGSGLIYSYEGLSGTVHDRCLAILPQAGGTRRELPCGTSQQSQDSVDAFSEAAPGPDGKLLFTREWSLPGDINPRRGELELSTVSKPGSATTVLTFPYTATNGHLHSGISHIRWLSPTRAIYLASTLTYPRPCSTCEADTVSTGIELVELDLSGATPTIQPIPGTDSASSVDVGATGDEIFFTRNGDSRVYQMDLSSGVSIVAHDFGSSGIARDVAVFGNQLYAVVGGHVDYVVDPLLGPSQLDRGGKLFIADLINGTDSWRIVDSRLFKRPVISPQRDRLVAESFPITVLPGGADTVISRSSDLWLLDLP
ncbi:MAG TPA: hypothetical protein VGP80_00845 [Gemmatimonadales bacterium]|jgi:hypothetical protein|nr:hypothetical protein [Gemmatimonadales bacterium]